MRIIPPITITDAILLSSNVAEDDYAAYNAGTTYALGARVILLSTHKIYESAQAANTAHNPPDYLDGATPWWLEVGSTNRWAMLDGVVGSQTTNADSIEKEFDSSNQSTLTMFNMNAVSVEIEVTDNDASEVVYSKTISLLSTSNVIDAWTYAFAPFIYTRNMSITFPMYPDSTISIKLINTGGTAKCGELFLGNSIDMGKTSYGIGLGMTDYSVTNTDDFGNYTFLQRGFSKKSTFDLKIRNAQLEYIYNTFTDYRVSPVVWIGTDVNPISSVAMTYGKFKDFQIVIPYLLISLCSLEIEGLT